ncbi:uncharacterized protein LOC110736226 [Chenopodium quinoa]|uniref:uncharacterized protein LOC110736226 n=1 Tax=Chenopodium quinoa TaxID=63459 RepID=UPI000B77A198|nr:uncharacterized protein LOC110736226 [Chenopodium quinoa]
MEPETLLKLYDTYWFDHDLFSKKKPTKIQKIPEIPPSNPELPTLPTIHTKSAERKISSNSSPQKKLSDSSSASPNSVLFSPKLQTIFSGRISADFEIPEVTVTTPKTGCTPLKGNLGRIKKKKNLSKSLSDLEFEELKGFIDLGFVFSEEDKDSSLATIIPGLHSSISRPYLSEAWEELEKKRRENYVFNWKVPAPENQVQMKDYLRFWAHTVASTVK